MQSVSATDLNEGQMVDLRKTQAEHTTQSLRRSWRVGLLQTPRVAVVVGPLHCPDRVDVEESS